MTYMSVSPSASSAWALNTTECTGASCPRVSPAVPGHPGAPPAPPGVPEHPTPLNTPKHTRDSQNTLPKHTPKHP